MTSGQVNGEMLRTLVREVLRDLLPGDIGEATESPLNDPERLPQSAPPAAPAQPGLPHTVRDRVDAVETVNLHTDQDLGAFVMRLLHLFENPKHRDDLRAGRVRFRLATPPAAGSARPSHRIDKGAVTEAAVRDAERSGARLVLGRRAVLTPLARDRARAAGVEIERER